MFLKIFQKIFLPSKSWKNHPQKLLRIPQIHFFPLTASTAQMAQTEKFMFQNVAYRPNVYKLGKWHKKSRVILQNFNSWMINQGPLKKWTEHSQELHLLKIHSRGGSYYTPGLDGGRFFGPWAFIILKSSYQDLSNEGLKKILSSLELVF